MQITERRIAGPEIIDMDMESKTAKPAHGLDRVVDIFHDHAFRYFQRNRIRGDPGLLQDGFQLCCKVRLGELFARYVHAHFQRRVPGVLALPGSQLAAGLAEDPVADVVDQTVLLGQGYEFGRIHHAPPGMFPPDEGFKADQAMVLQLHDRLVMDDEFVVVDRPPEVRLQLQAVQDICVHARVEDLIAGASPGLRLIHGDVGVAQDLLRPFIGFAAECNADAHGREDFVIPDQHGFAQLFVYALRDIDGVLELADIVEQYGKFVSAETGNGIAGTKTVG